MIDYTTEQLYDLVTSHLMGRRPLAVARYGDGEAIVLNGFRDMEVLKMVMKRQLGFIPPVEHIEQVRENLVTAYRQADIIGVPVRQRLKDRRSYWYRAFSILLEHVGAEVITEKQLTDIDFHSHWLEGGYFDRLLRGRDRLCYISCRNLDAAFMQRYGIANVYSFIIAPEMKFTSGYKGEPHYPNQFNKIRKWMTKVPVDGCLCLVGAGVIGKLYTNWFKEQGGIAIDIGSVFDSWAGKSTRGPGRGLDKQDSKFKL